MLRTASPICRFLILLLGLTLGALGRPNAATAQRAQAGPLVVGRTHSLEDTVQAVRRLFNKHDATSTTALATGIGGLSAVGVGALMPAPFGNPGLQRNFISAGTLLTGVGAGLSLRRMLRFSRKHRDQVLAAYQQGEPLPRYVRRRLRPEHFQAGR